MAGLFDFARDDFALDDFGWDFELDFALPDLLPIRPALTVV